jgi:hypothetical protein
VLEPVVGRVGELCLLAVEREVGEVFELFEVVDVDLGEIRQLLRS